MDIVLPEGADKTLMLGWFVCSTLVVAGFALSTGVNHLFDWWYQRHDKEKLAFSIICLTVGGHTIALVFLNETLTVDGYVLALKADLCLLFIAQPAFVWFVTSHMRVSSRHFIPLFLAYFGVLFVANILSANSLMASEVVGLFVWLFPAGEPHVSAVFVPSTWSPLCFIGTLATYVYGLFVIYRGRHNVERREVFIMAVSLVCMFATWLQTLLVNPPVLSLVLLSHYAFLAFMFLMGSALASRYGRQALALTETHQELQDSEERFRMVVEKAPDAIIVYDLAQNRFVDVNTRATQLFGCRRADLLGVTMEQFQSLLSLGTSSSSDSIRALGHRAMAGEEQEFEMAFRNRAGADLICEVRLVRLPSAKHQVIRASLTDISERRQAEKRHLEYQRRLRSLASELALTEERERKRIAVYLHDEVAQDLVAAQLKLCEVVSDLADPGVGQKLDRVQKMLGSAIEDTYSLTFELSLPILYELGLIPAIEWLGEKICESDGIRFRLVDDGLPKPLSNDIRAVCFDVTRELLRNVVKHARASEVSVTVRTEESHLWLEIQDDGVGFNVAEPTDMKRKDGGFGMFCVRERLENFHGTIRTESECGCGTRVTFSAPLSNADLPTGCA